MRKNDRNGSSRAKFKNIRITSSSSPLPGAPPSGTKNGAHASLQESAAEEFLSLSLTPPPSAGAATHIEMTEPLRPPAATPPFVVSSSTGGGGGGAADVAAPDAVCREGSAVEILKQASKSKSVNFGSSGDETRAEDTSRGSSNRLPRFAPSGKNKKIVPLPNDLRLPDLSHAELKAMYETLDVDGDGVVSTQDLFEFVTLHQQHIMPIHAFPWENLIRLYVDGEVGEDITKARKRLGESQMRSVWSMQPIENFITLFVNLAIHVGVGNDLPDGYWSLENVGASLSVITSRQNTHSPFGSPNSVSDFEYSGSLVFRHATATPDFISLSSFCRLHAELRRTWTVVPVKQYDESLLLCFSANSKSIFNDDCLNEDWIADSPASLLHERLVVYYRTLSLFRIAKRLSVFEKRGYGTASLALLSRTSPDAFLSMTDKGKQRLQERRVLRVKTKRYKGLVAFVKTMRWLRYFFHSDRDVVPDQTKNSLAFLFLRCGMYSEHMKSVMSATTSPTSAVDSIIEGLLLSPKEEVALLQLLECPAVFNRREFRFVQRTASWLSFVLPFVLQYLIFAGFHMLLFSESLKGNAFFLCVFMSAILLYGTFIEHIHKHCGWLYVALRLMSPIKDVPMRILRLKERTIFSATPTLSYLFNTWEPFVMQDMLRRKRVVATFGIEAISSDAVFQTPRTIVLLFTLIQTCVIAFSSYCYTILFLTTILQSCFLGDGFLMDEAVEWRLSQCHFAERMAEEFLVNCFSFEYKNEVQHYYDTFGSSSVLSSDAELENPMYTVPVHLFLELYRVKLMFDKYGVFDKDKFSPTHLFWQRFVASVRVASISVPALAASDDHDDHNDHDDPQHSASPAQAQRREKATHALLLELMPLVEQKVNACDATAVQCASFIPEEDRNYALVLRTVKYMVHTIFPWARLRAKSRQEDNRLLSETEVGILGVEFNTSQKLRQGGAAMGVPIDINRMRAVGLTAPLRRKIAVFSLILTLLQVPHPKDAQSCSVYTLPQMELLSATFLLASGPALERSGPALMFAVAHMRQIEKLVNVFRHNLYTAIHGGATKERIEDAFTSASVPKMLNLFKDV